MATYYTIDPQPGNLDYSGTFVEDGSYGGYPIYRNGAGMYLYVDANVWVMRTTLTAGPPAGGPLPWIGKGPYVKFASGDPTGAFQVNDGSQPGPAPTFATGLYVSLSASAAEIDEGDSVTLTWTSVDATEVVSSNFSAATVSGTASVSPTTTTTYTITVGNGVTDVTDTVEVTVIPATPLPTTIGGSGFGFTGDGGNGPAVVYSGIKPGRVTLDGVEYVVLIAR